MDFVSRLLYSPFYVQLVACRRCNLSCKYCNEFDKVSQPVPTTVLKQRIKKIAELGSFSIAFTGGEPLLHPELPDLIAYIKSRKMKAGMITNGYLLNESVIEKLNAAGLDGMQLSIDGVEPNDITVKTLRPMMFRLKMLQKLAKFQVNINSVIGVTNPQEAVEVVKTAQKLGFSTTIGLLHDGNGQIKLTKEQIRVYQHLNKPRTKPYWDVSGFEDSFIKSGFNDFKCRAGSRYLYVDEFGLVHFCSQQMKLYAKDLMKFEESDLKTNFFSKKPCSKFCTVGCVRRASWPDSLRRQN